MTFTRSSRWLKLVSSLCIAAIPAVVAVAQVSPQVVTNASFAPLTGDFIQLGDGSILHGALRSISVPTAVRWQHPEANGLIEMTPENIDSIRFEQAKAGTNIFKAACRFQFRNGDEFSGILQALDNNTATIDTWFGKDMKVPRSAMESITFLSKTMNLIYEGPTSAEGWNFGRGNQAWKYRDGALVATGVGTVGRRFGLPGSCSIEFEISWVGPAFELAIPIYTDAIDRFDYGSSSYMFHLRQNTIVLQRVHPELGVVTLGRAAEIPNPRKKNNYHVEIRASKEEATIAMLVDGVLLFKAKDDAGFNAKGAGVVFFSQHDGGTMKLSNIKVSEWDGRFENDRPADASRTNDVLRLANKDKVQGQLEALNDNALTVATGDTRLKIPVQRISQLIFREGETNATPASPWEIRAALAGGEKISFKLEQWDGQQLSGTSAILGKLKFGADTVRQMFFNPGKNMPATQPKPAGVDWEFDVSAPEFTAVRDKEDALLFRTGDMLYGHLIAFDGQGQLQWQRSDFLKPVEFKTRTIGEIRFRQETNPPVVADCRITLINSDQFDGRITAFDTNTISLETTFAGKLDLPRKRIQMIVPMQTNRAVVFQGPTSVEGWTMGKVTAVEDAGVWHYKNGAIYASKAASIARDFNLPDVASIQFDLAWKGTLQTAIALYTSHLQPVNLSTKDSEPDFGGFYSLQINNVSAGLMMVKKDAPLRYLWQLPVPNITQKNSAHIEIRVDKPKRTITLMIDGVVFKQAIDPEEFAGSGTCLRFVHQGLGSLKLSNLTISQWDGQSEERFLNFKGTNDIVKLRNGDRAQGTVESYAGGKLAVAMEGSKLEIPLDRIKQIDLAGKRMEAPVQDSTESVAYFKNGATLNFQVERVDKAGIHASSPNFGKATLNPAAFSRLVFRARDESAPAQSPSTP